jgi:hypothetical protein
MPPQAISNQPIYLTSWLLRDFFIRSDARRAFLTTKKEVEKAVMRKSVPIQARHIQIRVPGTNRTSPSISDLAGSSHGHEKWTFEIRGAYI